MIRFRFPHSLSESGYSSRVWAPRLSVRVRAARATASLMSSMLQGPLAGALAEDEEVRERVPTQAVGPVHAAADFARGEEPGDRGFLGLRLYAHPAHLVVAGGADLHRLLRDIDIRQLLELMIHAG